MSIPPRAPTLGRRAFLTTVSRLVAGAATVGLGACADGSGAGALAADAALPEDVPAGAELAISIRQTRLQLEAAGLIDTIPFRVRDWPNLEAGPDVIQGFRARSVDLASNAGVPPIQARAIGFDARIVAVRAVPKPTYVYAVTPGAGVDTLAGLRGKKIAFSQGQAQGVVVLRTLKELGLSTKDVTLVPLTSNQFYTALQSRQVDAAPLFEPSLTKYLDQYGRDGAKALPMNAVDYITQLWAPSSVLGDPAKAAAVRAFIPFWVRANVWAWENQDAWIDRYYVKDQEVTVADGKRILAATPPPVYPSSWDRAIAWEQETADLLAAGGFVPKVRAAELFDRRFERFAAQAAPDAYRGEG